MKIVIDLEKEMYKEICRNYKGEDTPYLAIKDGLVLPDNFLYPLQLTDEQILGIGDRYIQLKRERTYEKKDCRDCIHYEGEDSPCDIMDCSSENKRRWRYRGD